MQKCPANNDQFIRQMNRNIVMDALTSQIELSYENLRMTTSTPDDQIWKLYLAINNNNNKSNTASYERKLD